MPFIDNFHTSFSLPNKHWNPGFNRTGINIPTPKHKMTKKEERKQPRSHKFTHPTFISNNNRTRPFEIWLDTS